MAARRALWPLAAERGGRAKRWLSRRHCSDRREQGLIGASASSVWASLAREIDSRLESSDLITGSTALADTRREARRSFRSDEDVRPAVRPRGDAVLFGSRQRHAQEKVQAATTLSWQLLRRTPRRSNKGTPRPQNARDFSTVGRPAGCCRPLRERGCPRTPEGSRTKHDGIDNRDAEP